MIGRITVRLAVLGVAPSGPGPDPADRFCNNSFSSTAVAPVATVPFAIPGGLAGK